MTIMRRALFSIPRILNSTTPIATRSSSISTSPIPPHPLSRSHLGWVSRFYSNTNNIHSGDIDLSNEESKRRLFNRLVYRSKQRGFLELDLILGKWVEEHIHSIDQNGIKALVDVLDLENPDLWKWLTGQEQPPEAVNINPVFSAVRDKLVNNLNSHAAPETRAIPGQPWVRGWDDIKKGPDSPISGNQ